MMLFRRQPPNFRLNCLSYHKKCSAFREVSPPNLLPGTLPLDPAGGSAPRPPLHPPHRNPGSATKRKTGGRTSYLRRCKNLRHYGAVRKGARRSLRSQEQSFSPHNTYTWLWEQLFTPVFSVSIL